MANKRMLDKSIICSDAFIGLSPLSQCLYIQINMNADDDGFVNNILSLSRVVGCSKENVKELVDEKFILDMGKGIYVVKHWFINNTIRKDRYCPTKYQDLLATLYITADKKYRFLSDNDKEDDDSIVVENDESDNCFEDTDNGYTNWQPTGNQPATQSRVVENSIDKCSIDTHTLNLPDNLNSDKKTEIQQKNDLCACETDTISPKISENYAKQVFDVFQNAELPCANGNFQAFAMREFYQALPVIRELHLSSAEVIQAVKNYAQVVRKPDSWWASRQNFYNFCSSKTILRFIPGNFDMKQYENKVNTPKHGSMVQQLGLDQTEEEMPF